MKKALSIFLAAVMLLATFTVVPAAAVESENPLVTAAVDEANGLGKTAIAIANKTEFEKIGDTDYPLDAYYYLTATITFDAADVYKNTHVIPGTFTGVLNGCGNMIEGISFGGTNTVSSFFEDLGDKAVIKNLQIGSAGNEIAYTKSQRVSDAYAVLARKATGATVTIQNVHIYADMTITANGGLFGCGGFIAYVLSDNLTVSDSSMNGSITINGTSALTTSSQLMLGGLLGRIPSDKSVNHAITLSNCVNNASITTNNIVGSTFDVGGIAGALVTNKANTVTLNLTGCVNNGKIELKDSRNVVYCGGLVGRLAYVGVAENTNVEVSDSLNTASISVAATEVKIHGNASFGGFIMLGGLFGDLNYCKNFNIKNSKNTGDVSVTFDINGFNLGGILGTVTYGSGNTIDGCSNYGKLTATRSIQSTEDEALKENLCSINGFTSSASALSLSNCCNNVLDSEKSTFTGHSTANTNAITNGCYDATIVYEGYQLSDAYTIPGKDGQYRRIRFVAVINTDLTKEVPDYSGVGFNITTSVPEKGPYGKLSNNVYSSIIEDAEPTSKTVYATECGGSHFVVFTIGDIPVSANEVTFTVTPYTVSAGDTANGEAVTVSVDLTQAN